MSECSVIGALRNKISIEVVTRTPDGQAGHTQVWAEFASVFAKIKPVTAQQKLFAQRLDHTITHKITIRFITGVTSGMRIIFKSRIFHIKRTFNIEEANKFLEILAVEGDAS